MSHFSWLIETLSEGFGEKEIQVIRILTSSPKLSQVFLRLISINPLAFFHECRSLIGYATHYSVVDSK